MNKVEFLGYFIKIFFVAILSYCIFNKIINSKISKLNLVILLIINIFISLLCTNVKFYIDGTLAIGILYLLLSFLIAIISNKKIGYVMITEIIALAITYAGLLVSGIIEFQIQKLLKIDLIIINYFISFIIETLLVYGLFKIRRLKNGFSFLQDENRNDYIDIFAITMSVFIIGICCLFGNYDRIFSTYLFIEFLTYIVLMVIVIQKTLTLCYKQKQLEKTVEHYENEVKTKDDIIEKISEEKYRISKINHEFYNRQKALEAKVQEALNNVNIELVNNKDLKERIGNLTKEYSDQFENIKEISKLPLAEIDEIDDMFKYMQKECCDNNIDFKLVINGNINYMINNLIPKNRLETLIGDHLRDAIIAIKNGNNKFKSIMCILGNKNNCYELCIYDSGIEFEIDTLLGLGKKPITTHKDAGGSGIGFMTTFETLKDCNATLMIEEKCKPNEKDYTKSVRIIFNNKNEYIVSSYRENEIKTKDKENRMIFK